MVVVPWKKSALALLVAGTLSACGGGGSSSSADIIDNDPTPSVPETSAPDTDTPTPQPEPEQPTAKALQMDHANRFLLTSDLARPSIGVPAIAEDGDAAVMWMEEVAGQDYVKVARYDRANDIWMPARQLDNGSLEAYISRGWDHPRFDVAMGDQLLAAAWWDDNNGLYASTHRDDLGWQGNPTLLSPVTDTQVDFVNAIVSESGDEAMVIWQGADNMWISTYSIALNTWSPAVRFFDGTSRSEVALHAVDGQIYAAWNPKEEGSPAIRIARYNSGVWFEENVNNPNNLTAYTAIDLTKTQTGMMAAWGAGKQVAQATRTVQYGLGEWTIEGTGLGYNGLSVTDVDIESSDNGITHLLYTVPQGSNYFFATQLNTDLGIWKDVEKLGLDLTKMPGSMDVDRHGNALVYWGNYGTTESSYAPDTGWDADNMMTGGKMNTVEVSQSGYGILTSLDDDRGILVTMTK